jgi:hypothetical protein
VPYALSGSPLLAAASPVGIFLGPFLAAFIMTGITEGRAGIGRLLRRFVMWRVPETLQGL